MGHNLELPGDHPFMYMGCRSSKHPKIRREQGYGLLTPCGHNGGCADRTRDNDLLGNAPVDGGKKCCQ